MKRTNASAALLLACLGVTGGTHDAHAADDSYAYGWTLEATPSAAAYRLRLTPSVYAVLASPNGDDMALYDAAGRRVPHARLAPAALTEPQLTEQALVFEVIDRAEVDARTASGDRTTIELELRHDGGTGTRLSLRGGADVRGADGHLLYEAVIASPAAIGEANDVQLSLALTFEASAAPDAPLDCRVRDADGTAPATDRLPLNPIADSRPRRFDARLTVDTLPRAWHLLCFGSALPADFALQNARLELRR
jgi:hypothetical protein